MTDSELISAISKNDVSAKKQFYETYYPVLSGISIRYAKNKAQSNELLQNGMAHLLSHISNFKSNTNLILSDWVRNEFIKFCVEFIRNIRSEYYVASTVRVTDTPAKNYDLFVDAVLTDFKNVEYDVLIESLHQLVPSQRLIYNLHVVEEYDLRKAADILEASEQTVKANLEKARYNLQKNIDKNFKSQKNEQSV
ncbi:MAG TPA: sigma-70 family RNA polymerase sigma factor [Bacteroidia bacterium]|nr:sigma-70 family RNA polymerase sigma factor [Bacteroidia bacterium]